MKHLYILIILSCPIIGARAQYGNVNSTKELAEKIMKSHKSNEAKVRAAYSWVTANIRYNSDNYLAINNSVHPRDIIDVAFERRKGVCANFSAIFADICQNMGFNTKVIDGYKTPTADLDRDGHSWVGVFIDQNWYLFDPTWDVGKTSAFSFYKSTGAGFIDTHMPFDPMWQLLDYPIIRGKRSSKYFNYKDSIQVYFDGDSLYRFESSVNRIAQKGAHNKLTATQVKVLKLQLEIKRQEEQMNWYESAVALINEANRQLNQFIGYRNEEFSSIRDFNSLNKMLSSIQPQLDSALIYLARVDDSKANLVYGTWQAREKIDQINKKTQEQKLFIANYFSTPSP